MFKFENPQKIFQIGKVKVGGQPGELPTVMIGTIFYRGHKILKDPHKGIFDEKEVEALLKKQDELSDETGNPCMLDVYGETGESLIKEVDFISRVTDTPILIDGLPKTRIECTKHVAEVGLVDRAIYNSICYPSEEELEVIREAGIKLAILLPFNARDRSARGRFPLLRSFLSSAEEAGVDKPLVDVTVQDIPEMGPACRASYLVKKELGMPAGFAPSNATTTWAKLGEWRKRLKADVYANCHASGHALSMMFCDFLMYGPIEQMEIIFPSCAMADAIVASAAKELGTAVPEGHPLHKLFEK